MTQYRSYPESQQPCMLTADDVADFFLHAADSDSGLRQPMTNMRLQKLLYYAQAWSLALAGEPLFGEDIEAWEHGPVVRSVYMRFKQHGSHRLSTEYAQSPQLTPAQRSVLDAVWASYGDVGAARLRVMAHRERPWREARQARDEGDTCNVSLSHDAMREYFAARLGHDRERRLAQQRTAYAKQPTTALERALGDEALALIASS